MSLIEKKIIDANSLVNVCESLQRQIRGLHECIWKYESYCGLLNDTALKLQIMSEVKEKVKVSENMSLITEEILADYFAQKKNQLHA